MLTIVSTCGAAIIVSRRDQAARARESEVTVKALAEVSQSLRSVAATQRALEVRVSGLAPALAALQLAAPAGGPGRAASRLPVGPAGALPPPPVSPDEHPRSAEATAADDTARAIVADAVRVGRWTDTDRDRLREAFAGADADARTEIMRQFSVAANTGKLRVELEGPPF